MDCTEAKNLFVEHILGELEPDCQEIRKLEAHLARCPACFEDYQGSRWTVGFIEEHKAEFAEAIEEVERKEAIATAQEKPMSQEELEYSWRCIEAKLDKREAQEKREKRAKIHRILFKISTIAASLAIGALAWLMLSNPIAPEKPARPQVVSVPAPTIRIRMLSDDGGTLIPTGRQIASVDSLKTLFINEKHRIVLNSGTTVSLEPLTQNNRLGCLVKLASGQIYAHVEHDGNPFVVETAHGRVVINGTTFDVKATKAGTTLVVVEGSIEFESEKGNVEVAAGQISKITPNAAPTRPVSCKTAELTAWATAYELKPALAKIQSIPDSYDLTDLGLSVISGPIELERIDYENWIEEKRSWFKREFPWIFQLQSALVVEGIEIDYPELLISSGDIWQFVCPEVSPSQIPVVNPDSLLKAASQYSFNEQWLLENVSSAKFAIIEADRMQDRFIGLKAFQKWAQSLEGTQQPSYDTLDAGLLLYSVHAGTYLANTKTLAWLCVKNTPYVLKAEDGAEVLDLLQSEVNAANKLTNKAINLLWTSRQGRPCDEYPQLVGGVIEDISVIMSIEKTISAYKGEN